MQSKSDRDAYKLKLFIVYLNFEIFFKQVYSPFCHSIYSHSAGQYISNRFTFYNFTASGPVRLFTPYKRRKRNQTDDVEPGPKRKRNTHSNNNNNNSNTNNNNNNNTSGSSINNNNSNNNVDPTQAAAASVVDENNMFLAEDNITSKDEPWATLNDSLDTSTEMVDQTQIGNPYERETYVVNINDTGSIAVLDSSQSMKNIEHVLCTMVKATSDFKRLFNDVKQNYERRIELLQKERDAAVSAMRVQVHTDIDDPNISGSLHGNEIISAKKVSVLYNWIDE